MEKKIYYKKKDGEAHMGQEWDSNESATDSSDEDAANIAVTKGLLFPNVGHKCLMAKGGKKKKVHSRDTPKYTTSDDECSSSDDCHTRFWKANQMRTMYVLGSETHVHIDYIIGHHRTMLEINNEKVLYLHQDVQDIHRV
jgi:hypothetical protein